MFYEELIMKQNIKNIYCIEMNDCKILGDIVVTGTTCSNISNSENISKKEGLAREYAKSRYGNNGHESGNEISKVQACTVGYIAGWDDCMKHLAELPWNEAVNEIVKHIETNRSEKRESSE